MQCSYRCGVMLSGVAKKHRFSLPRPQDKLAKYTPSINRATKPSISKIVHGMFFHTHFAESMVLI
jgi:hypothetical protein